MSNVLTDRLNKILPKLVSDDFLSGSGIGNEIAFYIFDYPPEDELRVRDHVRFLLEHIPKQKPGLRVKHVNLFDFVLDYLKTRNLLEKAVKMQREKGDEALKKALAGPMHPEKLAPIFCEVARPQEHDLVLVSGVGNVYPLLRTSGLLSNLQKIMGHTPLVVFYPGKYDQMTLRLFGKLSLSATFEGAGKTRKPEHYYRAFRLVP
jgi:hypothetical protein